MAFGPVYQGVFPTVETRPEGFAIESVEISETLLEANGLSAFPLLIGPVVLTALVVAMLMTTRIKPSKRKVSLWVAAVLLLGFCVVGAFSIGMFYLPAALALVVAAVLGSRGAVQGIGQLERS
jgi:hypothetical protein